MAYCFRSVYNRSDIKGGIVVRTEFMQSDSLFLNLYRSRVRLSEMFCLSDSFNRPLSRA